MFSILAAFSPSLLSSVCALYAYIAVKKENEKTAEKIALGFVVFSVVLLFVATMTLVRGH